MLGAVSGLVPHFTGGTLRGRVTVAGRDTRTHAPRELADVVGTVGQDPLSHFVTDTVEDELAYGMESLGLAPEVMRRRVEETLDLLGLADLRDRPIATLSGGQQQRVAIGSVLTPHPRVLVLDEPTSALDPAAAEEVLAVLQRLVHDLGTTVLLAEHRLERVIQYADQVALLPAPGAAPVLGTPAEIMAVSPCSRRWSTSADSPSGPRCPSPCGTRGAGRASCASASRTANRRAGLPPRLRVGPQQPPEQPPLARTQGRHPNSRPHSGSPRPRRPSRPGRRPPPSRPHHHPRRDDRPHGPQRRPRKSTLLNSLVGLVTPTSGTVRVGGLTPHRAAPRDLVRRVGLVPQEPRDLLCADTVAAECTAADADADAEAGTCRALVSELLPGVTDDDVHPRDLSEGQRLALALAIVLTARPPLLLLDEPTRGLDYAAKSRLVTVLRALAAEGHAIVLATHDVELAAELAHRVVLLADGEVIADGPTAEVVVASPSFAPQTTKILAPQRWLTVAEVRAALA